MRLNYKLENLASLIGGASLEPFHGGQNKEKLC